jgi:hypothetical protein
LPDLLHQLPVDGRILVTFLNPRPVLLAQKHSGKRASFFSARLLRKGLSASTAWWRLSWSILQWMWWLRRQGFRSSLYYLGHHGAKPAPLSLVPVRVFFTANIVLVGSRRRA